MQIHHKLTRSRVFRLIFFASSLLILMFCFRLIILTINPTLEKNHALYQAQAKWQGHIISSYRMVVTYKRKLYGQEAGSCQQVVEVHNNTIVVNGANQQPCRSHISTIADLFQQIEHDTNIIRWDQCDVLMVSAEYDPEFGYPRSIRYKWEFFSPLNLGIDFFSKPNTCTILDMFNPDIDDIEILSFSPLGP
jgi:hypothetical protein